MRHAHHDGRSSNRALLSTAGEMRVPSSHAGHAGRSRVQAARCDDLLRSRRRAGRGDPCTDNLLRTPPARRATAGRTAGRRSAPLRPAAAARWIAPATRWRPRLRASLARRARVSRAMIAAPDVTAARDHDRWVRVLDERPGEGITGPLLVRMGPPGTGRAPGAGVLQEARLREHVLGRTGGAGGSPGDRSDTMTSRPP